MNGPTGTIEVTPSPSQPTFGTVICNCGVWLAPDTPFGQIFGASGPSTQNEFIGFRGLIPTGSEVTPSLPSTPSSITFRFDKSVPANAWGFAFGSIDFETIQIVGTDGAGNPLTGAQLNGGTFNYCDSQNAPTNCRIVNGGPQVANGFSVPNWNPATSTCTGGGGFSNGGTCWFRPGAAVGSLTFLVTGDIVTFEFWMAALKTNLTIDVGFPQGGNRPVQVDLYGPDQLLLATRTFTGGPLVFENLLAAAGYVARIVVPQGLVAVGGDVQVIDLSGGSATVQFAVVPTAVHPARSHPEAGEVTLASFGTLPTTGSEPGMPVFFAVVLLAVGVVLLGATRRRFV